MRILLINDFTDEKGGAEIYNRRLQEMLESRGHVVRFFGSYGTESPEWKRYFRSWYNVPAKRKVRSVVNRFAPDLVHCHNLYALLSPSVLQPVTDEGIPVVMKFGDNRLLYPFFERDPIERDGVIGNVHPLLYLSKNYVHRRLLHEHVSAFYAPSEYTAKKYQRHAGFRPVRVIYNPVPWQRVEAVQPSENEEIRVLFVGSITEAKGVVPLVCAVKQLGPKGLSLSIVGDGPKLSDARALVRGTPIEDTVQFHGHLPQSEVRRRYRDADVFALPSTIPENAPLTIIEAMSQGLPVVTTDLGGQAEFVDHGETGLLAVPRDASDLADKLKTVIQNDALRLAMAKNALASTDKFTSEGHAEAIQRLFQEVRAE